MAYAPARSCNNELDQGMTDGTYKQVARDRGGVVEATTYATRRDLNDWYFGIHEAPRKETPDGLTCATPTYVATPPAHLC